MQRGFTMELKRAHPAIVHGKDLPGFRPGTPAVYRPGTLPLHPPAKQVLQQSSSSKSSQGIQPGAPPVFRPSSLPLRPATRQVLQQASALGHARPGAPPVFRSSSLPLRPATRQVLQQSSGVRDTRSGAPPIFRAAASCCAPASAIQRCHMVVDGKTTSFSGAVVVHSNEAEAVYLTENRAYKIFKDPQKAQDEWTRATTARDTHDLPIPNKFVAYAAKYQGEDDSKLRTVGVLESTKLPGKHYCRKHPGWEKVFKKELNKLGKVQLQRVRRSLVAAFNAQLTDPQFLYDPDANPPLTFIDVHVGNTPSLVVNAWILHIDELLEKL